MDNTNGIQETLDTVTLRVLQTLLLLATTKDTIFHTTRLSLLESDARLPVHAILRGVDALDLRIQLINLFEGKAFSLVDEKVHKGDAEKATAKPDEEDLGL